jgi:hypothetical protein
VAGFIFEGRGSTIPWSPADHRAGPRGLAKPGRAFPSIAAGFQPILILAKSNTANVRNSMLGLRFVFSGSLTS